MPNPCTFQSLTHGFITRDGRRVEEKDLFCYNTSYNGSPPSVIGSHGDSHGTMLNPNGTTLLEHSTYSGSEFPSGINSAGLAECAEMLAHGADQSHIEFYVKVEMHGHNTSVFWSKTSG